MGRGEGKAGTISNAQSESGNTRKQNWVILGFCLQQEKEGNLNQGAIEMVELVSSPHRGVLLGAGAELLSWSVSDELQVSGVR